MYCLYLRKSRADIELESRGEMETLARHKKALLDLAKKLNLSITQIYEEIVSGETIQARPVVRQLLDEVEQGLWSGVLVMEIERLARGDTIDQGIVARAFKLGHAKIITPTKTFDPDNEFDEEYFEFGLFMSRREYKTINRRIQRGRVASAKEGKFLGSTPPYGYQKVRVPGDKGYTLSPDENEAAVVKLIFEMYTGGFGMTAISGRLDAMGIKPRYRDTWSKSTISDILSNPVYTGVVRWSYRRETKYVEDGTIKKHRTQNDEPIVVNGLHPPLVPVEVFEKAQAVRKANTKKTTKVNLALQNQLSGIVRCQLCGGLMTRLGTSSRNKYDVLICPNRYCNNVSAPIFLVEDRIVAAVREWISEYQLRLSAGIREPNTGDDLVLIKEKSLKILHSDLDKIELQISNTFDLLEQGVYTVDLFTSRNRDLSERKEKLYQQIATLQLDIEATKKSKDFSIDLIPRAIGLLETYSSLQSAEEKNAVLHQLLDKVVYLKTKPNKKGQVNNDNFIVEIYPKLWPV